MNNLNDTDQYLQSLKNYKLLIENAVECIWLFNLQTMSFKYISPSITNLRGLTVEEVMNEKIEDSLTPESLKKIKKFHIDRLCKFMSGDRSENVISNIDEYNQYCKDGTIKTIEISTKFIVDEKTNTIDILGVSRDITRRKKLEKRLINELKEQKFILKDLLNEIQVNFPTSKCRIYYFKKFLVYGANSNDAIKWRTSKSEELFAYLLKNAGIYVPKWVICEALWPEYDIEKINNLLHTTIYKMKKVLTSINLNFNLKFRNGCYCLIVNDAYVDIIEFDSIVSSKLKLAKNTIHKYEKAFSLYKNAYLEENDYIWSFAKRENCSKKFCKLAISLVQYYSRINDYTSAERIILTVLEKSPLDEYAHEALLKLYLTNNDYAKFINHYNYMKDLFETELGIQPNDSIQSLYHSMLSDY
ncbi:PAS domain S-box protein [Clostridium saccharobutylicum]|uniref:Response regulator receiver and SARP domain protein n=1 Tax=Clostridium saccharobutylicum DSM 13864 TaxID=1345695 RepID=U5MWN8_CLOSA|nr:PAS domain S-box protein [Clostridium saccharobutylicum]AGX45219.1 response regulator receiver and SARP domain protein [Clostridium saccharobutylicum DSM 13864]AQR92496.1 bacterial transcriptional activator domain protein [Clostridium saccharobutylicum]AQS02399.1 bacterial transcriptional activator domain protein [Clostridium saccharobutylicum]AQS12004.1 bacterial transcriptional activator domain protein [Clostridium saccharobutylicum]AQS16382.1 bacterial transcriptional activator domain pr